ncbi:MAG: hypothetical protein NTZ16_00350 [Verrucomicrobia bacterium]|nr:hypothetical protein [Verrucomicrobiota bacterium]
MNHAKLSFNADKAGCVFGAVLLVTLTGCIGYVDRPRARGVYVAPPVVEKTILVEDDYVYYPGYEVYYSSSRHQYAYPEGGRWILRPAPRGVSVNMLLASPSVRMNFHDAPARHHAEIIRQYPRNWAPPDANQIRNDNRKNNQRDEGDERKERHGR